MLVKGLSRLVLFIGPLLTLLFIFWKLQHGKSIAIPFTSRRWKEDDLPVVAGDAGQQAQLQDDAEPVENDVGDDYREVFSVSTANKKYFPIEFGSQDAINPSIIPHPNLADTWIITGQLQRSSVKNTIWFAELVCNAVFEGGELRCVDQPMILPIATTPGDKCDGDLSHFRFNIGPHDARVFYGPESPYAVYGSNSEFTCFGQWMLDFRVLVDWGFELFADDEFRHATEIQRPEIYSPVEKNFFVFWDSQGQMYAHYDVFPKRVFAQLSPDGSVGPDLALSSGYDDEKCMTAYMPSLAEEHESIHQATNSLSITLCSRNDPNCQPSDSNTFIFTIFHHKKYYSFHCEYEPYVMLFQQNAPFSIYSISTKSIWIHGRAKAGQAQPPDPRTALKPKPWDRTEMFYITSMSWKAHGQKYHGYIDDVLFLNFGIEDARTAAIDITAGDLFMDLGPCSSVIGETLMSE